MEFLLPIFMFYGVLLFSLGAGLLACAGAFMSRRRHRWIWVAGLSSVLLGGWLNYHYKTMLLGAAQDAPWFTAVGLSPIALGGISLVRWFLLKA